MENTNKWFGRLLLIASVISLAIAIISLWLLFQKGNVASEWYVPLAYLGAAAGFLIAPNIKSLEVGQLKVQIEEAKKELSDKVEQKVNEVKENIAINDPGKSDHNDSEIKSKSNENISKNFPYDIQKGKWGSLSERNGRKLTAKVKEDSSGYFRIVLTVTSTEIGDPIIGEVIFHLHQTFRNKTRIVNVSDGQAKLILYAYGAFTVGAECDSGRTKLELDLSELPGAPKDFREN